MPELRVIVTKKDFQSSGGSKKSWFRWIWRLGLAGVGLVLLGLLGLVMFFPSDTVKEKILSAIEEQTGHTATLGDIDLAFSLIPTLHLHEFVMKDAEGTKLVDLSHAKLTIAVMPLLDNQVHIKAVELNGAKVFVVRDKDGRINLLGKMGSAPASDQQDKSGGDEAQSAQGDLNIESLKLSGIAAIYRDKQSGIAASVEDFNASGHISLPADESKPIEAALESTIAKVQFQHAAKGIDLVLPQFEAGVAFHVNRKTLQYDLKELRVGLPGVSAALSGSMNGTDSVELAYEASLKDLATIRKYIGDLMPVLPVGVTQAELSGTVKGPAGFWGGFPQSGNAQNWINVLRTLELDASLKTQGLRTSAGVFANVDMRILNKDKQLVLTLANAFYDSTKLSANVELPLTIPLKPVVAIDVSKLNKQFGDTQLRADSVKLTLPLALSALEGLMPGRIATRANVSMQGLHVTDKANDKPLAIVNAVSWQQGIDIQLKDMAIQPSTGVLQLDDVKADIQLSLPNGMQKQGKLGMGLTGASSVALTKLLPGLDLPAAWQEANVNVSLSHPALASFQSADYMASFGYLAETEASVSIETKGVTVDGQAVPDTNITVTLAGGKLSLVAPQVKTPVGPLDLNLEADASKGLTSALPYVINLKGKALTWSDKVIAADVKTLAIQAKGSAQLPSAEAKSPLRLNSTLSVNGTGVKVSQDGALLATMNTLGLTANALYDDGAKSVSLPTVQVDVPGVRVKASTALALDKPFPINAKTSVSVSDHKALMALLPGVDIPAVFKQLGVSGTVQFTPSAKPKNPKRDDVFAALEGVVANQSITVKHVAVAGEALRDVALDVSLELEKAKIKIKQLLSPYGPVSGNLVFKRAKGEGYYGSGDVAVSNLNYSVAGHQITAKRVAFKVSPGLVSINTNFDELGFSGIVTHSSDLFVRKGKELLFASKYFGSEFAGSINLAKRAVFIRGAELKTDAFKFFLGGHATDWGLGSLDLRYGVSIPKIETVRNLVPSVLQGLVFDGNGVGFDGTIKGRLFDAKGNMIFTAAKADAIVSAKSLKYDKKVPLENAKLTLSLVGGKARMVLNQGHLFGDPLNGAEFVANMAEERPTWQLDKVNDSFAMGKIMKVYASLPGAVEGKFNLKINKVGAKGFAQEDLRKTMSGKLNIGLNDGKVHDVEKVASADNLPNSMKLLFLGFNAIKATGIDRAFSSRGLSNLYFNLPETYEFSVEPAELTIKNGRIHTPSSGIHVKSGNAQSLTFHGSLGLDNTVNGTAIISDIHRLAPERYQKYLVGLTLPIGISGSLDNPQHDDRHARKALVKLATKLALQKVLGGGPATAPAQGQGNQTAPKSDTEGQPQQPPANTGDPKDALKDQLKEAGKGLLFDLLTR